MKSPACPKCRSCATKIFNLSTGLYRCQICDNEYQPPPRPERNYNIPTSLRPGQRVFVRCRADTYYGLSALVLYRAPGMTVEKYDVGFDDGRTACFRRYDLVLPTSQTARKMAGVALAK